MNSNKQVATPARILLVEDNEDHAYLLIRALRKVGNENMDVQHIDNGIDAIEHLNQAQKDNQLPDLVLLDLQIPGLNGHAVLKKIKQDTGTSMTPVIILTTSDAAQDRQEAYAAHANGYVVKPTGPKSYNKLAHSVHDFWLEWNSSLSIQTHL